jgi:OmpA-OmpF porin, OOP family
MKRLQNTTGAPLPICLLALTTWIAVSAHAADASSCADVGGLKRIETSSIVLCENRDFAEYTLPTGKSISYDSRARKGEFEAVVNLEGRLTQNVYAVPKGASSAEVFRNYKADLTAKGYSILFEAKQADIGPSLGRFFENMGPGTQIWGYSSDEARYAAAVKENGSAKTYIALYVIEYDDGYDSGFHPEKGQVMVRLDAVQVGELTNRMVTVSPEQISTALSTEGHIALYGILFDFNKATIKPESRPTLDAVAKYLEENPTQNIVLTGHSDNVGGLDFNMHLSQARAAAVAADLKQTYGIQPGRITAKGLGPRVPVASNETEEGRAKNRRVELSVH